MNQKYPCLQDYYLYYNPTYPQYEMPMQPYQPQQAIPIPQEVDRGIEVPGLLPTEQSYIENILRLNLGKTGTFYMTYEGSKEWNSKVFIGVIEAAGRDHIIISNPETGQRVLLLMVNLDYVTFDEELNYMPPNRQ